MSIESVDDTHFAYGADQADLETMMRFGSVKRWHMIDTTRQQTLAEHSACVAGLVWMLAKTTLFFGPAEIAASCALFHDISEVFTGDIPSHTKRYLSGIRELEDKVTSKTWPQSGSEHVNLLIKLCDLSDGIRFIRLHGVDITAVHARVGLEQQFKKKLNDCRAVWPPYVVEVVERKLHFYAYEKS